MIISKVKIHPLFYFVIIVSLITGNFKNIISFTSLVLIHEIGHITTGIICNWKIESITLLPFGGITTFNTKININLIDEFFVSISGPLFQIIFFFIFKSYLNKEYHLCLLLFNLIPIFPLDGYKIIRIIFYNIIPFKYTNYICIIISFIIESILIINYHNLAFTLIIICLIFKGIEEYQNNNIIFNKFLLERYLYNFNYKKIKKIKKIDKMYLNKKHILKKGEIALSEQEFLHKMFDN